MFTCMGLLQQIMNILCQKCPEVEVLTLERQMFERHLLCGPSLLPDILWVRVGVLA